MEASDPFATTTAPPAEGAGDDPFANDTAAAALEPTTTDDVAAEVAAEQPAEDIPVVDREGQPVEQPGIPATATAAGRAAAAEAAQAPQDAAGAAETAEETTPATEPAGDGAGEPPQPPTAASAPAPDPQPEPSKEKGELRLYKLLYQTGPDQWTEADLSSVAADLKKYVGKDPKDKANKDGLFLKARNNDHARRLAFAALGRPEAGATVELVARTSWKPVRLSVAPPEPSRERLVIS